MSSKKATPKKRWGADENKLLSELFDNGTIDPEIAKKDVDYIAKKDVDYIDTFFEIYPRGRVGW